MSNFFPDFPEKNRNSLNFQEKRLIFPDFPDFPEFPESVDTLFLSKKLNTTNKT